MSVGSIKRCDSSRGRRVLCVLHSRTTHTHTYSHTHMNHKQLTQLWCDLRLYGSFSLSRFYFCITLTHTPEYAVSITIRSTLHWLKSLTFSSRADSLIFRLGECLRSLPSLPTEQQSVNQAGSLWVNASSSSEQHVNQSQIQCSGINVVMSQGDKTIETPGVCSPPAGICQFQFHLHPPLVGP